MTSPDEFRPGPGRVSPYAAPPCKAVYRGPMSATPIPCVLREHRGDRWAQRVHRAEIEPLPGSDSTRIVSWL